MWTQAVSSQMQDFPTANLPSAKKWQAYLSFPGENFDLARPQESAAC